MLSAFLPGGLRLLPCVFMWSSPHFLQVSAEMSLHWSDFPEHRIKSSNPRFIICKVLLPFGAHLFIFCLLSIM